MLEQLDFKALIDVCFVLLVTVSCLRGSRSQRSKDAQAEQRMAWMKELRELEASIRGLITQAAMSAGDLERQAYSYHERGKRSGAPAAAEVRDFDELPNESWVKPSAHEKRRVNGDAPEFREAPKNQISLKSQLEVVRTKHEEDSREEKSREEKSTEGKSTEGKSTVKKVQPNILDPVTRAIASRLLISGKEIHVVARKLDLPLSEIRALDRILRRELRQKREAAAPLPEADREDDSSEELNLKTASRAAGVKALGETEILIHRERALL